MERRRVYCSPLVNNHVAAFSNTFCKGCRFESASWEILLYFIVISINLLLGLSTLHHVRDSCCLMRKWLLPAPYYVFFYPASWALGCRDLCSELLWLSTGSTKSLLIWDWEYLTTEIRVPIPSCVVHVCLTLCSKQIWRPDHFRAVVIFTVSFSLEVMYI